MNNKTIGKSCAKKMLPHFLSFCCVVMLITASGIITSCASGPRFSNAADFCGIVVNSNGVPISGYRVSIVTPHLKEYFTFTDEKGIFIFHDVPSGSCTLSGECDGWGKFYFKKQFVNRSDLTYVQVYDSKTLFEQSAEQIIIGNFIEAERIIDEITIGSSSEEEMLARYLRAVIYYSQNEIRAAKKEIAAIEKIGVAKNEVISLQKKIQEK